MVSSILQNLLNSGRQRCGRTGQIWTGFQLYNSHSETPKRNDSACFLSLSLVTLQVMLLCFFTRFTFFLLITTIEFLNSADALIYMNNIRVDFLPS